MRTVLLAVVAAIGILAVSSSAQARDPYVGEWSADCTALGAPCWLDIRKEGKTYQVAFIAAERMDGNRILCRVDARMKRGGIRYDAHNTFADGLSGDLQGSPAFIAPDSNGGAVGLGGGLGAGLACNRFVMQNHYYFIGD